MRIYLEVGDSSPKGELIPHDKATLKLGTLRGLALPDELAAYQLVGEVMAHQGYDA